MSYSQPPSGRYHLGRRYNRLKKAANDGGKGTPKATVDQSEPRFTADKLAEQHGVSAATVKRAAGRLEAMTTSRQSPPAEITIDAGMTDMVTNIDAAAPAKAKTTEIVTPNVVEIIEDGRLLHGTRWTLPEDYQTAEVFDGSLGSMKGVTPPEWPGLDAEPAGPSEAGGGARFSTHSLPRPLAVRPSGPKSTHCLVFLTAFPDKKEQQSG